jgi:serine/threonine protein kinase
MSIIKSGEVVNGRYEVSSIISQSVSESLFYAQDKLQGNENTILHELTFKDASSSSKAFADSRSELAIIQAFFCSQVQRIRDFFQSENELFVVEDYISGESYRSLLNSKKLFNEVEIVELLRQVIPVLNELHRQSISHRNISPETIILRASDRLPVLTSFGVIRELLANQGSEGVETHLLSQIKKLPIGFISPGIGEDLYSLAVTAIILLTGKDINSLFNQQTRMWEWDNWVIVSDQLSFVLNKMLSIQPMERFSSTEATLNALNDPRSAVSQQSTPQYQQGFSTPPQDNSPKQPQAPTPEQIIATAASAATATTIAAKAAATATANSLQKASTSASTNLKKVQLQDWQKAALVGSGAGLLLIGGGVWFLQTRSEPPATIITSVAVTPESKASNSSPAPSTSSSPAPETGLPSPASQITKESASSTVQQWLAAKRTMFAPPYDRALGAKILAEKAYQDNVDKSGASTCNKSDPDSCLSSMDWLRTNNAQYTYGVQKLDSVGDFQANGDRASIFVTTTEYRTLHQGSKSTSSGGIDRVRYDLKYESGTVKITDYKVLK